MITEYQYYQVLTERDEARAKVDKSEKHINILEIALSEIKAIDDGDSGQEIGTILGWATEQTAALKQESE